MSNAVYWDHQRAFLAVIEEGSLSGAARRLGVSQPTVRGWIAALEEALDTRLFSRSVNGLIPTETACALVVPARAMSLASEVFVRVPDKIVTAMDTWVVTHEDLRSLPPVAAVFDHLVAAIIDFIAEHR